MKSLANEVLAESKSSEIGTSSIITKVCLSLIELCCKRNFHSSEENRNHGLPMSVCCESTTCCDPVSTSYPGPQGNSGANGDPGADGVNSYSLVANYSPADQPEMPPESGNVDIIAFPTAWMGVGQPVYVENWGTLYVAAIINANTVTLTNPENAGGSEYLQNAILGTPLPALSKISPGGWQGPTGSTPGGALLSANNLNDVANAATARANLGLNIGVNVMPYNLYGANLANLGPFTGANEMIYNTGLATPALTPLTAFARTLLDDSDAATARATLGISIGANVMPWTLYGEQLGNLGGSTAADQMIYNTGVNTPALTTLTAFARTLLDDADAATARATLGISNTGLDLLVYRYQKTSGNNGGAFSNPGWQVVPLTLEVTDAGGHGSLSSNEVTLAAGTYRFRFCVVANDVGGFQGRLYNVTDAAPLTNDGGSGTYTSVIDSTTLNACAIGVGRFTIAAPKAIRMEAYCDSTNAVTGFGAPGSFPGSDEVWSWIEFEKE